MDLFPPSMELLNSFFLGLFSDFGFAISFITSPILFSAVSTTVAEKTRSRGFPTSVRCRSSAIPAYKEFQNKSNKTIASSLSKST